jgi:hypothetical protein
MRKSDKKDKIAKVNLLAEQRHLISKGLISENDYNDGEDYEKIGREVEYGINPNEEQPQISDEPLLEADNAKYDLNNPAVASNLKLEIMNALNKYLGISNTDDAGMSNDNRVFIHKNLTDWVNTSFPPSSLRMGVDGSEYYTNRPEEMGQFLQSIGINDFNLKSVR